jgi:hypothetical protein
MRRRVEADCIDHKGNVRKITEIMIKNTNSKLECIVRLYR